MFGTRLWPRVDHRYGEYDYEQLCTAVWFFSDINSWLAQSPACRDPRSRAITLRLSIRWPMEYIERALTTDRWKMKVVYRLFSTLTKALEDNPDAECKIPPYPHIEGQW